MRLVAEEVRRNERAIAAGKQRKMPSASDQRKFTMPPSSDSHPLSLCTFGYEGLDIDIFIARLKQVRIRSIVDVRELPLSRKNGFSKSALAEHLRIAGIGYLHLPALGCPRPIRDRYRCDDDWTAYTRAFLSY